MHETMRPKRACTNLPFLVGVSKDTALVLLPRVPHRRLINKCVLLTLRGNIVCFQNSTCAE